MIFSRVKLEEHIERPLTMRESRALSVTMGLVREAEANLRERLFVLEEELKRIGAEIESLKIEQFVETWLDPEGAE